MYTDETGALQQQQPEGGGGFKEELEFNFDEDMDIPTGRQNRFSAAAVCDSDTDLDELSDGEISKLLIVTQTPNRPRKHEGYDRTGDFTSRAKMTQVRGEEGLMGLCLIVGCFSGSVVTGVGSGDQRRTDVLRGRPRA